MSMKSVNQNWWWSLLWSAIALLCLVGTASAESPLNIYVVNYPLKYFSERIGGPHVKVTLPVPANVDPVYWQPGITDISAYQQADLILLNGAGYAKWVSKVSLPRTKTVDTSRGFRDQYITIKETITHSHGAEGEHAHEGLAFTTWLDLSLAARQAEQIFESMIRRRPQQEKLFRVNYQSLKKDLLDLDSRMRSITSPHENIPILFSHPIYDYLQRAYGLNGRSVHWEPDQEPSVSQMTSLKELISTHTSQWMIWERNPLPTSVEKLEAIGIQSTVFDPCGNQPPEGNFLSIMQDNISKLESIFH
jgi:zinc transport system substrate-binding protein